MSAFEYALQKTRVVFGTGTVSALAGEADRLGLARILLLSTPGQVEQAKAASMSLGGRLIGHFAEAKMHTPVDISERAAEQARRLEADAVLAIGGGSTTGLGKAISLRTGLKQIVVPTSYAGSEMTPILGETEGGRKTTRRSPALLPDVVVYDVELTKTLPIGMTVTSAMNAIAHAVEALYAKDRNPVTDLLAADAIRRFANALPILVRRPEDADARTDALRAAWACGTCLGQVSMALHHKLCHVLGGLFDLPHAETHSVILPHATAYNATVAARELAPISDALGGGDAAQALFDLAKRVGAPTALRELGMPEAGIAEAARAAVENPYWNPRGFDQGSICTLLENAWHGRRPGGDVIESGYFSEDTSAEVVIHRNAMAGDHRLAEAMAIVTRHIHACVKELEPSQEEWIAAIRFLTQTGHKCDDWRQEFILLSDVLGVSMLVDAINNRKPTGASESTVLGPFHVAGAPELEMGANICLDLKGEPMVVRGHILDTDGAPIDGATVDVWQANDEGFYDVQQKGLQPEFNLRGMFRTGPDGAYWFRAVKPKCYPIPADGPVGKLLRALGRHPYRPAHLHYIIKADGFEPLITHIFDPDDQYIDSDAVFGVKASLLANFKMVNDPDRACALGFGGPFIEVEHDFVLARAGGTAI